MVLKHSKSLLDVPIYYRSAIHFYIPKNTQQSNIHVRGIPPAVQRYE